MDMSIKLNTSYPTAANQATAAAIAVKPASQSSSDLQSGEIVNSNKEPQRTELDKAVKDIQEFVDTTRRQLDFSVDDSTGKVVVKVIATASGEVIRQLPSEAALKLAQSLSDAGSLLFDDRA